MDTLLVYFNQKRYKQNLSKLIKFVVTGFKKVYKIHRKFGPNTDLLQYEEKILCAIFITSAHFGKIYDRRYIDGISM